MPRTMGERIKRLRDVREMTQKILAVRLNTLGVEATNTLVSKWETDDRKPDEFQLLALAEALDVTVWELGATQEEYPRLDTFKELLNTRVSRDGKVPRLRAVASRAGPSLPIGTPIQPPLATAVSSSGAGNKHRRPDG